MSEDKVRIVPVEPTQEDLARDIVMWSRMHHGSDLTPRNLFTHLERIGREIPQWLRDEPEMKNLDHVPSKGTQAAIIYKAMLSAAPASDCVPVKRELLREFLSMPASGSYAIIARRDELADELRALLGGEHG